MEKQDIHDFATPVKFALYQGATPFGKISCAAQKRK
jgi:hypothetical protein